MSIEMEIKQSIVESARKYTDISKIVLLNSTKDSIKYAEQVIELVVYFNRVENFHDTRLSFDLSKVLSGIEVNIKYVEDNLGLSSNTCDMGGLIIYSIWEDGLESLQISLEHLDCYITLYEHVKTAKIRDLIIFRFKQAFGLCRHLIKIYLHKTDSHIKLDQKHIIKQAVSAGLLQNEISWHNILHDYLTVTQYYSNNIANRVVFRIIDSYYYETYELLIKLKNKLNF